MVKNDADAPLHRDRKSEKPNLGLAIENHKSPKTALLDWCSRSACSARSVRASGQGVFHRAACLIAYVRQYVRVGVQGDRDGGILQGLLHELGVP